MDPVSIEGLVTSDTSPSIWKSEDYIEFTRLSSDQSLWPSSHALADGDPTFEARPPLIPET